MDSIDELIRQLQIKATGAHVHTINKAVYYLEVAKKRQPGDVARTTMENLVKAALATDDWTPLKNHMARWW